MRKWLAWIVGFALFFGFAFAFLLVGSLSQPSIWLPAAFGFAFYGLLSFSPRIEPKLRVGLALFFGSVACLLWFASGGSAIDHKRQALQTASEALLLIPVAVGGIVALSAGLGSRTTPRPAILPAVVLMLLGWIISYFSSAHGGATPMVSWVMRHLHLGQHAAEVLVIAVRKTIHFTFYGFVTLMGLVTATRNGSAGKVCAVAALLTTLAYASFDELRQSSQPDRTGSAWDVLLDLTGGSVALGAVYALRTTKPDVRPKPVSKSSTL
ncbi:MAG TPA: VanZ family protein [Fimbriimonadaceae bacterium]|nr:VanZ family protein [Fimbriimonadaceae bacterium]